MKQRLKKTKDSTREIRAHDTGRKFEVRANADNTRTISGYAALFENYSHDGLGFREVITRGAFTHTLRNDSALQRMLYEHESSNLLGRVSSGSLTLTEDAVGLRFACTLPDTSLAKDLTALLERGDLSEMSWAFSVPQGGDEWSEVNGQIVRRLNRVSLYEVSLVSNGMYPNTSANLRNRKSAISLTSCPLQLRSRIQKGSVEKRYRSVLNAVSSQKWAILPEKLQTITALLDAKANGVTVTRADVEAALASRHGDTPTANGVAVIPVYGTISQRMSMLDESSGGTSCEDISKAFRSALADNSIGSIVFDIDSPGGTVTGVPELAAEIRAARGQKPITAVANGQAASAAYWLASAADRIVVTPSGEVGSIGVYTVHQDVSAAMKMEGVKNTFIQAGKYKTEGNPYEPLSDEAKANMQAGVDAFYDMFTRGVAGGRGVSLDKVLSDFGQGRMLLAADAVAAGMADEVATLGQVLSRGVEDRDEYDFDEDEDNEDDLDDDEGDEEDRADESEDDECDEDSEDYDPDADCFDSRSEATAKANAHLLLARLR